MEFNKHRHILFYRKRLLLKKNTKHLYWCGVIKRFGNPTHSTSAFNYNKFIKNTPSSSGMNENFYIMVSEGEKKKYKYKRLDLFTFSKELYTRSVYRRGDDAAVGESRSGPVNTFQLYKSYSLFTTSGALLLTYPQDPQGFNINNRKIHFHKLLAKKKKSYQKTHNQYERFI